MRGVATEVKPTQRGARCLLQSLAGALALARTLEGLLYGVAPNDPATLAVVLAALTTAAAIARWMPASQAASVDPAIVLRGE